MVTNYKELIDRIKLDHEKRQESRIYEPLPISIFDAKVSSDKLTKDLQGKLLHSQLLINSLLRMNPDIKDKTELVMNSKKIYQRNHREIKIIEKFDKNYRPEDAVAWYTRDCFLSRLLNKALRTQNIDVLFLFQFFVHDIRQFLENNRCQSEIRAYRSQLMTKKELKKLQKASGQFISINSFISATMHEDRALKILEKDDNWEQVLFFIEANPKNADRKPFALITPNEKNAEDEVLFMLGSIFEVLKVSQRENIWQVNLRFCSDTNLHLDSMNQDDNTKLLSFGNVLLSMGKIQEAETYYVRLREQLSEDTSEYARCLEALAGIAKEKEDYKSSIELYNYALKINEKISGSQYIAVASNYISLGEVYQKENDHKKANECYQKAFEILNKDLPREGQIKLALCLNNIGILYQEQKKYEEALQYYNQAFDVRSKLSPKDEIILGMSLNNIGNAHYFLRHYEEAIHSYQEALKLYKKNLPPQHEKIASTYNNLGATYDDQGKEKQALAYYNDALKIYQSIYPDTHPKVVQITENIERINKPKN